MNEKQEEWKDRTFTCSKFEENGDREGGRRETLVPDEGRGKKKKDKDAAQVLRRFLRDCVRRRRTRQFIHICQKGGLGSWSGKGLNAKISTLIRPKNIDIFKAKPALTTKEGSFFIPCSIIFDYASQLIFPQNKSFMKKLLRFGLNSPKKYLKWA